MRKTYWRSRALAQRKLSAQARGYRFLPMAGILINLLLSIGEKKGGAEEEVKEMMP